MTDEVVHAHESPEDHPPDDNDVKVFLINRRDIVRRGLHALIEDSDDLVVVGEATDPEHDLDAVASADPDVAIVDAASRTEAVAVVQTLHEEHGDLPTLILDHSERYRAREAVPPAGADAYLPDDAREGDVRDAVRRAAGRESADRSAVEQTPANWHRGDLTPDLTYRERQILRLIALGMTNRQIGDRLGLAEKTVKNYISTLLAKLHLERRTQAAIYQITHEDAPSPPDSAAPHAH